MDTPAAVKWSVEILRKEGTRYTPLASHELEDGTTSDEAMAVYAPLLDVLPPTLVVTDAARRAGEDETVTAYEARLATVSPYRVYSTILWDAETMSQLAADFNEAPLQWVFVTAQVLVPTGTDPADWDWAEIALRGGIEVMDTVYE